MKRTALPTISEPRALPPAEEMERAWKAVDDWYMHWYQLLFFHEPRLTSPGSTARPFRLGFDPIHRHCIKVECNADAGRREEFDFLIYPKDSDENVLRKCELILGAINKARVSRRACCALAERFACVCEDAFRCPLHGSKHIGTHD